MTWLRRTLTNCGTDALAHEPSTVVACSARCNHSDVPHGGQILNFAVVALVSTILASSAFASTLPRKSHELTISEPSGKTTRLSELHGKVVVIEFFFVQSNHCTRVARMLNKLNAEMGARGFQALGVVFDPPNTDTHGTLVGPAVEFFKLAYPVGYSTKAEVDTYLDRQRQEILTIPQIVVIDRNGMIRAESRGAGGDPRLENESSLRSLVDGLLNESHSRVGHNGH